MIYSVTCVFVPNWGLIRNDSALPAPIEWVNKRVFVPNWGLIRNDMKALFAGLHLLAAMDFAATGNASELRYVENGDLPLLTEEEAAKWKKE